MNKEEKKALDQAVDFLYEVPKFTSKHPLSHTKELMRRLGDPQDSFQTIHVAGSNGKGSVCSFFTAMLLAGGKRVGTFTSPHLVDIRERFLIDGKLCSMGTFLKAYHHVLSVVDDMKIDGLDHPTFFELLYAIGMVIFSREGVEYVVLETGLGGRLDATNLVKNPALTVITSICLEHTEHLGPTITHIANEKAGIIKEGVPVVYDANNEDAALAISTRAEQLNCKSFAILKKLCTVSKISPDGIDFFFVNPYDTNGIDHSKQEWSIPFHALYQVMNASLAICGYQVLFGSSEEVLAQMKEGLKKAFLPGRMQEMAPDIYLDGAHNPGGIEAFSAAVQELCKKDEKKPLLLFSMVSDKDYESAVEIILKAVDWEEVCVSRIPDERGLEVFRLEEVFRMKNCIQVRVIGDYKAAFDHMVSRKAEGQKLFCCGSLYFVGAIMALLEERNTHDQL